MKKILFLISISLLSGCSDNFLEQFPETTLNEGSFYQREDDFIGLANGLYTPMRDYTKSVFWILAEIPSDNSSFMASPYDNASLLNWQPSDVFINTASITGTFSTFWSDSYVGITRCNKLLREIDRPIQWTNNAVKERTIGEAKFMRALYYFNLVRLFGGVPLLTKEIDYKQAPDITRAEVEEVYNLIIGDLSESILHLEKAESVKQKGRATMGAAQSLLAKVHLTLMDYPAAEALLKNVIESGEYALLSDYNEVFNPQNKNHKETVFAVQYSEANAEMANDFIFRFAPLTSKGEVTKRPSVPINTSNHGWNMPTNDLISLFEEGDVRKSASIAYWVGEDSDGVVRPIAYCNKYKPPLSAPDRRAGDNVFVIRYSDVLLMYAEVLTELNRTVEAIPYLMMIRERAGLHQSIDITGKEALLDLIAKERQIEFCFENQRWFDLLRTGKALEVMTAHGIREKKLKPFLPAGSFEMNSNKLLLPIPNNELVISNLTQNPGY